MTQQTRRGWSERDQRRPQAPPDEDTPRRRWRAAVAVGSTLYWALVGVSSLLVLSGGAEARAEDGALDPLQPDDLTVTAGAMFPGFLIYDSPGPSAGLELGWGLSPRARVIANVGVSAVWVDGSARVFVPMGVSVRVNPWPNGPLWLQAGLGTMPYVERIGLELPERSIHTTDLGANLTRKFAIGADVARWSVAAGAEAILLPRSFYETYTGDETLPWDNTLMVWVGRELWRQEGP